MAGTLGHVQVGLVVKTPIIKGPIVSFRSVKE